MKKQRISNKEQHELSISNHSSLPLLCEASHKKGAIIQDDKSATLSCNNDQTVFVPFCKGTRPHSAEEAPAWKDGEVANTLNTFDIGESRCNELVVQAYGICSKDSNAMKSDNPHSGFYEADTSRTLDANGGNPGCNQGGIAVVAVQGSMIGRKDGNGPQGSGVNEDVCFTLDAADRHAVAYPTYCTSKNSHFTRAEKELANTLVATDYKDPPVINDVQTASGKEVFGTLSASMGSKQWLGNQEAFSGDYHIVEPEYIVRRLTPTECARLQGLCLVKNYVKLKPNLPCYIVFFIKSGLVLLGITPYAIPINQERPPWRFYKHRRTFNATTNYRKRFICCRACFRHPC